LLICKVEDLEIPLGLEIHAESFGLNVAYETNDTQASISKTVRGGGRRASINTNALNDSTIILDQTQQDILNKSLVSAKSVNTQD
jgi:hypothetical protein